MPLNMTRAGVGLEPSMEAYQAIRYRADGSPIPFYDFDHPGASAVFCSVHDLVRFGMFHLKAHLSDQKVILSHAGIDDMKTPTSELPDSSGYGVGWRSGKLNGHRIVSHGGGMGGVRTHLAILPKENIAIAVLCNGETDRLMPIFKSVLSAVIPDGAEDDPANQNAEPPAFDPGVEFLGNWKGILSTHSGNLPFTLLFQPDGDVHARIGDQFETLVNECQISALNFTGQMAGSLGTEDASKYPYFLAIDLTLRESRMNGAVTAIGTPSDRSGYALTSWADLGKS